MSNALISFRSAFTANRWLQRLVLLLLSFGIYFFYFHYEILHLNTILSSITGDAIKNYYTYVHHIKNDSSFLHFGGQNYPYGEHVIYVDCQPLLTLVLRLLPFTHNYLIGILHGLIFLTYIITPVVVLEVLRQLGLPLSAAFPSALAVSLLSPLYYKLFWGHFALIYNCIIPLEILLVLTFFRTPSLGSTLRLAGHHLALFMLHPYTGLSCSIFACLALFIHSLLNRQYALKKFFFLFLAGVLPILLFRLFIVFTDPVGDRSGVPASHIGLISSPGCILIPTVGPFGSFLSSLFHTTAASYEGLNYIGIFMIFFSMLYILSFPFFASRIKISTPSLSLLLASLCMLVMAFGYVHKLFSFLNVNASDLRHFRAIGRFACFFYFVLPIVLMPAAYRLLLTRLSMPLSVKLVTAISVIFFAFNLFEAHQLLTYERQSFWKFRNFFRSELLNPEEKKILQVIDSLKPQALTTLPVYESGSDIIDRDNANNSMISSMLYSFHSGVPILGYYMTRSSVSQAANVLNLLNPYKRDQPAAALMDDSPVIVFRSAKNRFFPDEKRLDRKVTYFYSNDSLRFGIIDKKTMLRPEIINAHHYDPDKPVQAKDSLDFIYIPFEDRKPFRQASLDDYEKVCEIQPDAVKPGTYLVSLHYYYTAFTFDDFGCNLIISRTRGDQYEWFFNEGIKKLSGMYKDFGVFECDFEIEAGCKYEFLLKGATSGSYHIRNFMLRPENATWITKKGKPESINNFPR